MQTSTLGHFGWGLMWAAASSLLALLSVGCAQAWKPLDASSLAANGPRSITLIRRKPVAFQVNTPGSALTVVAFGPIIGAGVAAGMNSGVAGENGIVDPSIRMGDEMLGALAKKFGLTTSLITVDEPSTEDDNPRTIQNVLVGDASGDLLLSVRTLQWGIGGMGQYQFLYHFQVKLIDAKRKMLLAGGDCQSPTFPPNDRDAPTYKQMFADNAKVLKQEIDEVVGQCLYHYGAELLLTSVGQPPPPVRKRRPIVIGESIVP